MQKIKEYWDLLAQASILIVTAIVVFLTEPPVLQIDREATDFTKMSQFVLAILIAFFFSARRDYSNLVRSKFLGITTLILAVIIFFGYFYLSQIWGCYYRPLDEVIVVGPADAMSKVASEFLLTDTSTTCADLIFNFASEVDQIWSYNSRLNRFILLAVTYTTCIMLFAISALFGIEVYRIHREDT